ncbi:hypothetical protein REPUB_Repub03eG0183100 [Reevesia pubescens]
MSKGDSSISSSLVNNSSDDDISGEWGVILIVYALVSFQLLLAVIVGAIVVSHSGISHFVLHTGSGLAIYIISIVLWFIIQCFLLQFRTEYPCNCLLFILWSVSFAFAIGFSCSFSDGRGETVLGAIVLMSIVAVCLTLYSIWGTIKNFDFSLGEPLISFIILLICIYVPIQVFHPFAKLSTSIYGFLAALLFCGHTFFAGNSIVKHVSNSRDDSVSGPIFAATVFVYWHFLVSNPSRRDIRV